MYLYRELIFNCPLLAFGFYFSCSDTIWELDVSEAEDVLGGKRASVYADCSDM